MPLARSARAFVDSQAWAEFGYARLEDHARERFGRSGRWAQDLAALGRMFSTLPGLEAAVTGADGGRALGRVAGLLVGRAVTIGAPHSVGPMEPPLRGGVAAALSLKEWLALAREVSVRELKDAVAAARRAASDSPCAGVAPGACLEAEVPEGTVQGEAAARGGTSRKEAEEFCGNSRVEAARGASDDDDDDGTLVRLPVPLPVAAAFDEMLDLFRAVEGHEAGVTSFVEALVAEAASGGCLPDPKAPGDSDRLQNDGEVAAAAGGCPDPWNDGYREPLRHGTAVAAAERACARATDRWARLPEAESSAWALSLAGSSLERLRDLTARAGAGDAADLDAQIRALVSLEDEIERRLGDILRMMAQEGAWFRLGFDSAAHYAEQRLGLRRSAARMRLRVARALGGLPLLKQAYEEGAFGMEAAYLASRVIGKGGASESLQRAWVARASEATVKRLRDEVRLAGRRAAGLAEESSSGSQREPVDDAAWHASLRREPGTARRRVAALGRLAAEWRGSDVFLRLRLPDLLAVDLLSAAETARERLRKLASEVSWDEPWPEPDAPGSLRAAREFFVRCRRTPLWVGLLALLEEAADTWDPVSSGPRRSGEEIFRRHGWRCSAPGCTSRKNLEEHHAIYRSRGGGDEEWNRLPGCGFHHQRGEHGGLARVRGRAPLGLTWSLGRNGCGGTFRNERRVGAEAAGRGPCDGVTRRQAGTGIPSARRCL